MLPWLFMLLDGLFLSWHMWNSEHFFYLGTILIFNNSVGWKLEAFLTFSSRKTFLPALLVPLGSWWRGGTVVMGVTAQVSRIVGAPAVSRTPGSQGTATMLGGVTGWGEPGSWARYAVMWLPMTASTTELNQEATDVSAPPQSWEGARLSGADTASAPLTSPRLCCGAAPSLLHLISWGCGLSCSSQGNCLSRHHPCPSSHPASLRIPTHPPSDALHVALSGMLVCGAEEPSWNYRCLTNHRHTRVVSLCHDAIIP